MCLKCLSCRRGRLYSRPSRPIARDGREYKRPLRQERHFKHIQGWWSDGAVRVAWLIQSMHPHTRPTTILPEKRQPSAIKRRHRRFSLSNVVSPLKRGDDCRFMPGLLHPGFIICICSGHGKVVIMACTAELDSIEAFHCRMISVEQQCDEQDRIILNGWMDGHENFSLSRDPPLIISVEILLLSKITCDHDR